MTKKKQFCPRGHDCFQGGRDRSGRCLICKAEDAAAREAAVQAAIADQLAAFERLMAERDRRREQEYQAAIERGGYDAAMARWDKEYQETLKKTGRGLCQWEADGPDGESMGRMYYRRTTGVYCGVHDRELQRETARKVKEGKR